MSMTPLNCSNLSVQFSASKSRDQSVLIPTCETFQTLSREKVAGLDCITWIPRELPLGDHQY